MRFGLRVSGVSSAQQAFIGAFWVEGLGLQEFDLGLEGLSL